jgi:hypothetical protein
MGYIPHVVMPAFKRGSYTNNYLIKDQVAPEHIWGLIHQGTKPRINPCLRHGYPGTRPGALDISRDLTAWSQTKNPSHILGALSRVFTAWSQTKNPSHLLGAHTRVFLLGPRPRTPVIYWGPSQGSFVLGPRPRTPVIYWGPSQGSFAMALTAWSQTKNPR